MKFLPFIFAVMLAAIGVQAQTLHGLITDEAGRPVVGASVYVHEVKMGTAANEHGTFELRLKAGEYTITVQCVGYETETQSVQVKQQGSTTLNIRLATKVYELPAVLVSNSRENYAYTVMRHAIAMAPYYANEVSRYRAEVYLKGSGVMKKLSLAVKVLARKELKQANIREGEMYMIESMNEITFTASNSYAHKVLSSNNTLPPGFGEKLNTMNFVNVNVYSLSMFAKDAMSNYRFTYEGCVEDGALLIYKIKIAPRKKIPGLMRGYVYIVDGTWRAYSLDVAGDFPFGTFSGKLSTNDVGNGVWLPTSYSINAMVKVLGNEVQAAYAGTVRYTDIVKNSTLQNPLAPRPTTLASASSQKAKPKSPRDSIRQVKRRKELEAMLAKDELSNRDMKKMTSLMQEEVRADKPVSLNISTDYKVEVDSNASRRDTTFWNSVRPVPLQQAEVVQMRRSDSLKVLATRQSAGPVKRRSVLGTLFFGRRFENKAWQYSYSGLLSVDEMRFNATDGFVYSQRFRARRILADSTTLHFNLNAAWAFSRTALMWRAGISYVYWPERRAEVFVNAGMWSSDYNSANPRASIESSLVTLITHSSLQALYNDRYVNVGNNFDIANGLSLQAYYQYSNRRRLQTHTNFALFFPHKRYAPNVPENSFINENFELHTAGVVSLALSYTPQYFYRMRGRQKRMARSSYPTFTLSWREGIPRLFGSKADFSMGRIAVSQSLQTGLFERFEYSVDGVKFFRNRHVDFPDFHHYRTLGYVAVVNDSSDWWRYYYRNSTPTWGVSANVAYTTPFLALKYIPKFDETVCRENIYARIIYTPHGQAFSEVGYAISEIFFMVKIGVFAGFENLQFRTLRVGVEVKL